ncbi:MvdC/MvdD family ATP grasp protein [Streptomyces chrestomyceticus]|uniref:MvdC/MvdD family ATP grasp protein n=1 Tax=Streptomyces chrestomyceticus TaxID=68185 RepID=UPI0036B99092
MVNDLVAQAGRPLPVCVIARYDDASLTGVIQKLHALGAPVLRFDLGGFPERVRLAAWFEEGRVTGTLETDGRAMALEDIGAVFWWHPTLPHIPPDDGVDEATAEWLSREASAGLAGTLAALDCLHVNHPAAINAAQNKPHILRTAAAAGLRVPPTWIGNAASARHAIDHLGRAVCKSLVEPTIETPSGPAVLFTSPVTAKELGANAAGAAHQFQQRITAMYEVRLICVREKLIAGRLTTPPDSTDFRAHYDQLTYGYIDVPPEVHHSVLRLLHRLDLTYAALDLLVDPLGQWWLVDVNPAGMWGFVEAALPDLAISAQLATVLANPRTTSSHHAATPSHEARTDSEEHHALRH